MERQQATLKTLGRKRGHIRVHLGDNPRLCRQAEEVTIITACRLHCRRKRSPVSIAVGKVMHLSAFGITARMDRSRCCS